MKIYDKQQLAAMSDLEINQVLTVMVLGNPWLEFGELVNDGKEFHVANAIGDPFYCAVIEYCSKPADIIPLAFEHKIDLIALEDGYAAEANFSYLDFGQSDRCLQFYDVGNMGFKDKNPLRAITCCLILVLQDKDKADADL